MMEEGGCSGDNGCQLCNAGFSGSNVALNCGHVLCRACFDFTRCDTRIFCPACNQSTDLSRSSSSHASHGDTDLPPSKRMRTASPPARSQHGVTAFNIDVCERCHRDEIGFWCSQCHSWLCVRCTADTHLHMDGAMTSHSQHDITSLAASKLDLYKDLKFIDKYLQQHVAQLSADGDDRARAITIEDIGRFRRYFADLSNVERFVIRHHSIRDSFPWVLEIVRREHEKEFSQDTEAPPLDARSTADHEPPADVTAQDVVKHVISPSNSASTSSSQSQSVGAMRDLTTVVRASVSDEKTDYQDVKTAESDQESIPKPDISELLLTKTFVQRKVLKQVHPDALRSMFGLLWVSNGLHHEKTDYFVQALDEQLVKVDELCGNFAKCSDMIQMRADLAVLAMCQPRGHTGPEPERGLYELVVGRGVKTLSQIPNASSDYSALACFGCELFAVPSFGRRTIECFKLRTTLIDEQTTNVWTKTETLEVHESKGQPVLEPISCLHVTRDSMFVVMREKLILTNRQGKVNRVLTPTLPFKAWSCSTLCKSDALVSNHVFAVFKFKDISYLYAYDTQSCTWKRVDLGLPESVQAHVYSACCSDSRVYIHSQYQIISYSASD